METVWVTAVLAPIIAWFLGRNGRKIEETAKLVDMLQAEIGRLNTRLAKMEKAVESKEGIIERKNYIIQAAFECRTPSQRCPVLIANSKYSLVKNVIEIENEQENNNATRLEEQQSGQHTDI